MAPREDDKLMGGMLQRTLASRSDIADDANTCPSADILAAYYEHSLDEDESARYELHFSHCAHCREQLAAMVRAEEAPQPKANWAWLWKPYLLAPALAVLVLAVFFSIHHSTQTAATATTNQPSNPPLVAMSRPDQAPPQEPAPKSEAPIEALRNAPPSQVQQAPSDSVERDSLSKAKRSQLQVSPAAPSAPLAAAEASPPAVQNALSDKKAPDMPLNGRNVIQLQPLVKSADAAKDGAAAQSSTQSEAITAAGAPIQTPQNAAPPRKESPQSSPASAGVVAEAAGPAGTGTAAANTTVENVNRSQTQAPAAMSRYSAIAKSPSPQIAAEISAQKTIQTPNTNVLWRSAAGGFVERSTDGGATWVGQPLPGASGEIAAGSSPAPKICWLVGSGGTIYMTKDAINWKKIAPPVPADFSAVAAKDASNATITATDGRTFQTTDGGKHWKSLP